MRNINGSWNWRPSRLLETKVECSLQRDLKKFVTDLMNDMKRNLINVQNALKLELFLLMFGLPR